MDNLDRAIFLDRLGLSTLALGPPEEWSPVDRAAHQQLHNQFWMAVSDIVPDDEADEPFWMSERAATRLASNRLFRK